MAIFLFVVSILTALNAGLADRSFKRGDITKGSFAAALVVLGVILIFREML